MEASRTLTKQINEKDKKKTGKGHYCFFGISDKTESGQLIKL